jgi:hypothetical protein
MLELLLILNKMLKKNAYDPIPPDYSIKSNLKPFFVVK